MPTEETLQSEQAVQQPAITSYEEYVTSRQPAPSTDETQKAAEAEVSAKPEELETPGDSEKQASKPKRDRTAEGRIAELTARQKALESERDEWRRKAEFKPEAPKVETKPEATTGKPLLKEFVAQLKGDETYEDAQERWYEAKRDWESTQAKSQAEQSEAKKAGEEYGKRVKAKIEEAATKYDDFDEVLNSPWAPPGIHKAIAEYIGDADSMDAVYYLAKNPDEADRIAKMSHARQIAEFGKIEERLAKPEPKTTQPATSKAPAPLRAMSGSAPEPKSPLEAKSYEEYVRLRKKPQ